MKNFELLSPAGNPDKLKMAIRYGADAVYCAGQVFGLRASSSNFSNEELEEAVKFVHERGKKIYVTCNIIPHNEDLDGLEEYLKFLERISVDAIIVADLGIFNFSKKVAPNLPLHVSTQANTTNYLTAQFWKEQGAERVVVAREVSIKDIKEMREKVDIEIEAFIHGAMCISYSGRCLLSNYMTARDANRGQCTQACRWKYAIVEQKRPGKYFPIEEDDHGTYIFNSKDLCLLEYIPALYDAGVNSLKIEGRMKSVHYVATVTKVYREAIDAFEREGEDFYVRQEWLDELEKISHRPYTEGFSVNKPTEEAQNYGKSSNTNTHDFIGLVEKFDEKTGICYLQQRNNFKVGDKVEFMQPKGHLVTYVIDKMTDEEGNVISVARHPQMKVQLHMGIGAEPLEPYSMMRREKEEQE